MEKVLLFYPLQTVTLVTAWAGMKFVLSQVQDIISGVA